MKSSAPLLFAAVPFSLPMAGTDFTGAALSTLLLIFLVLLLILVWRLLVSVRASAQEAQELEAHAGHVHTDEHHAP